VLVLEPLQALVLELLQALVLEPELLFW